MSSVLSKAIIGNSIVVSAVESKDIVNAALKLHGLSPVATAALGRALTMAALMGAELKNSDDYLSATVKGDGPLGSITVCADGKGNVKGMVTNPVVETVLRSDGHLDVAAAVGKTGSITVVKDIGLKQPYVGTSQLVSGEIAADFAYYFAKSEQQPCGVTLGVGLQNNACKSAGGVFVQVLPDCDENLLSQVETVMYAMDEMSYQFDGNSAREVISRFFGRFDPVFTEEKQITYKCDCSKSKINKIVRGLGRAEAQSVLDEVGKLEVCCHFCNKKYVYLQEDVDKLFVK
ncbi:MAG: Hsp33 family molecular chaperone HslO [Corallococcus sp.]|nr:Hsp33 family molecular chaperone HslO [Corallococcus sp.]MCM1359647.1 Hsp33 family molecular chaperone HslO [Corallococcus sp.]MCM1395356.1 Hsp33 family molecular chaperone HslO [Corallococcus sp.]